MTKFILPPIFLVIVLFHSFSTAQIYSYRGPDGKFYASNCPVDEGYRRGLIHLDAPYFSPRYSISDNRPGTLTQKAWDNYEETKSKKHLFSGEMDAAAHILSTAMAAEAGIPAPAYQPKTKVNPPSVTVIQPPPITPAPIITYNPPPPVYSPPIDPFRYWK